MAAKVLSQRNNKIAVVCMALAGYDLYQNGQNTYMIMQLVLSVIFIGTYANVQRHIEERIFFNRIAIRRWCEIISVIYALFFLSYYLGYHGYKIFTDFHWSEIGFAFAGIATGSGIIQNYLGFNVLLQNLQKFETVEALEVNEDEWVALSRKYKF